MRTVTSISLNNFTRKGKRYVFVRWGAFTGRPICNVNDSEEFRGISTHTDEIDRFEIILAIHDTRI